jgi:trans-2,3-dihydro-3-hydroxyanthranilate isomerase
MHHSYLLADVFTDHVFGGNQLAVFPAGERVPPQLMPHIARELNLSETVFVLPPHDRAHTRRLRIFTPGAELPFAGHPTIGTACVLAEAGHIPHGGTETRIVFEEGVGPLVVYIRGMRGHLSAQFSAAQLPEFGPPPPPDHELAEMLTLAVDDLTEGVLHAQAVSCGVPFLFVPLRDRRAVARARLNVGRWEETLAQFWAPHLYVFALDPELAGSHVRARMFAPAMGIAEDPATGGAACALAGYLALRDRAESGSLSWRIEQGFEMGRRSLIDIEADKSDGAISAIRVGGRAVLVGAGSLELPEA